VISFTTIMIFLTDQQTIQNYRKY